MLKIKNDVPIKELENYNFEQANFNEKYLIRYIYIDKEINYETLYIDKNTRELFAYDDYKDEKILIVNEWINDLIQADLVERVGGEDE